MVWRWTWRIGLVAATLAMAFALGGAVSAMRRLPDLQPWHQLTTSLEPRASELGDGFTLEDYLAREDAVFKEVEQRVDSQFAAGVDAVVPNRYVPASRSAPARFPANFNRTQVGPRTDARGGALLLHGLTDSPYSMRALVDQLQAAGFYTVSLRMQGHGTVPGGLVHPVWEDWAAAVRVGARHVRGAIGVDKPLWIVGYSNGGALAVNYALESLGDASLPAPARLVVLSPMIGVSPFSRLAPAISVLGGWPFFEKARWLDIYPEYNPFKYASFPANAGNQSGRLTRAIQARITSAAGAGTLANMPPLLVFQSVVDTTVSTPAVVQHLLDRLPAGANELVLFDVNRAADVNAFTRLGAVLPKLTETARPYAATLVTNAGDTLEVSALTVAAGANTTVAEPLGLQWPADLYSLSHVALPFPVTDPLYGRGNGAGGHVRLGELAPRGEKDLLIVPIDALMRATWNPFFPYVQARIDRWLR